MSTFTNQELYMLFRFQETQRRLVSLQNQVAASPLQPEIDALSARLRAEMKKTELLQKEINRLKTDNRRLETECRDYDYQLAQIEKSLYSGKISSPKELEQLQKRNSEYKNAREEREEKLINQLYLCEEQEKSVQLVQEQVEKLKEKLKALKDKEAARVNSLHAQIGEVKKEATGLETTLPEGLKAFYHRSVKTWKGVVIAPVKDGTCGSCHMILSQAVIEKVKTGGGAIMHCENCGRGLFDPKGTQ